MATAHVSFRLPRETVEQLDRRSSEAGQTRSHVAKTLIEEGLRMAKHPGVVFRPGYSGRCPALANGPAVWGVSRVLRDVDAEGEEAIQRTAELTGLTVDEVRVVSRYYAEYRDEIDAWIQRIDEESEVAERAWRIEQGLPV